MLYFNLGMLYHEQGDVKQARAHYEKAKALYEMVGDTQRAQKAAQQLRRL
jgi:tetratricopeptide (TPR) repeat protein